MGASVRQLRTLQNPQNCDGRSPSYRMKLRRRDQTMCCPRVESESPTLFPTKGGTSAVVCSAQTACFALRMCPGTSAEASRRPQAQAAHAKLAASELCTDCAGHLSHPRAPAGLLREASHSHEKGPPSESAARTLARRTLAIAEVFERGLVQELEHIAL